MGGGIRATELVLFIVNEVKMRLHPVIALRFYENQRFFKEFSENTEFYPILLCERPLEVAQICGFEKKWVGCPNSMRADTEVAQAQHELADPFRDCFDNSLFLVQCWFNLRVGFVVKLAGKLVG